MKENQNEFSCQSALAKIFGKHFGATIRDKDHYQENFDNHFSQFFELIKGKKNDDELYDLLIMVIFIFIFFLLFSTKYCFF